MLRRCNLEGQREEDRGRVSSTEPLELVSIMATLISRSTMGELWVPGAQLRTAGINPRTGRARAWIELDRAWADGRHLDI